MFKRVFVTVIAVSLITGATASGVSGQTRATQPTRLADWQPFGGRLIVSLSGAFQTGGGDLDRDTTFELYDEDAQLQTRQDIRGGALLDVGAAYRFGHSYGAGLAYTRTSSRGDAALTGALPHPVFFDRPRPFAASASSLRRSEHAVHFQAVWWMPFIEKVDFAFSAGPSLFVVRQAVPRGVTITEVPPDFNTVIVENADVATPQKVGGGFNVGVDATYLVTTRIAAGVLLRYSRGTATLEVAGVEDLSITAGGFQIGAGVRVRF